MIRDVRELEAGDLFFVKSRKTFLNQNLAPTAVPNKPHAIRAPIDHPKVHIALEPGTACIFYGIYTIVSERRDRTNMDMFFLHFNYKGYNYCMRVNKRASEDSLPKRFRQGAYMIPWAKI